MTRFLTDQDIALRPLEPADGTRLVDWQERWEETGLLAENLPEHFFERGQQAKLFHAADEQDLFIIERLSDGRPVGWAALYDIHPGYRQARLFIMIEMDAFAGKGYASKVGRLLLRYAFDELNLHRLECLVHAENPAAQALCRTLGFEREVVHREMFLLEDRFVDGWTFGLLENAFRGV